VAEEGEAVSNPIKLGTLQVVPKDNSDEVRLVTLRCLLRAQEANDRDLIELLAGILQRLDNPPMFFGGMK